MTRAMPDLGAVRTCMASGWSVDEIAEELDTKPDAVCRAIRLLELTTTDTNTVPLPERIRDCREGGLTWGEIAELLDMTPDEARHMMRPLRKRGRRSGRPKLQIDAAVILERRAAGETMRAIARALGVSVGTLENRLRGG